MKCIESIQARGKEQGQNIWHYCRKIIFKGFYYDLRSLFHELWTQFRFIYNPYFISHRIYGVSRYIYLIYIIINAVTIRLLGVRDAVLPSGTNTIVKPLLLPNGNTCP